MQVVALIDEEGGKFGVSFPDYPGCTTVAGSLDEAVNKAATVLAFHLEGLAEDGPLPMPRTLAELARDRRFRADVKGALAVLVPYTPPTRAVRLNVTLDEGLLELVDHAARDAGETRSGWLANAARRRLCEDYPAAGERKRA
jgi:predicted RNase H-like HicB family nuclease